MDFDYAFLHCKLYLHAHTCFAGGNLLHKNILNGMLVFKDLTMIQDLQTGGNTSMYDDCKLPDGRNNYPYCTSGAIPWTWAEI